MTLAHGSGTRQFCPLGQRDSLWFPVCGVTQQCGLTVHSLEISPNGGPFWRGNFNDISPTLNVVRQVLGEEWKQATLCRCRNSQGRPRKGGQEPGKTAWQEGYKCSESPEPCTPGPSSCPFPLFQTQGRGDSLGLCLPEIKPGPSAHDVLCPGVTLRRHSGYHSGAGAACRHRVPSFRGLPSCPRIRLMEKPTDASAPPT